MYVSEKASLQCKDCSFVAKTYTDLCRHNGEHFGKFKRDREEAARQKNIGIERMYQAQMQKRFLSSKDNIPPSSISTPEERKTWREESRKRMDEDRDRVRVLMELRQEMKEAERGGTGEERKKEEVEDKGDMQSSGSFEAWSESALSDMGEEAFGALVEDIEEEWFEDIGDSPSAKKKKEEWKERKEKEIAEKKKEKMEKEIAEKKKEEPEEIVKLPVALTGAYHAWKLTSSVKEECTICFEDFAADAFVARLDCFCLYHKACIDEWYEKIAEKRCPVHGEEMC